MSDLTCEQASDIAGESAATWAHMMTGDMDEQLTWFDEVYDSIMARLIRKELAKRPRRVVTAKIVRDSSTDSPPKRDPGA